MKLEGAGALRNEINVTPLVDVVLVLLIIFMVVTPLLQLGHEARVPPPGRDGAAPPQPLVLSLGADGSLAINREVVDAETFPLRLRDVLEARGPGVTLIAAAGELPYERVMEFVGRCAELGVSDIGIVTEELR